MDGELKTPQVLTVQELKTAMFEQKTNAIPLLICFLIKHGIVNSSNEPELDLLKERCHRVLDMAGPHLACQVVEA